MKQTEKKEYDVVVVGGGIGGVTAALSAARHGAKTALIQDRPMLGGNAGSEIRMHICGASCHGDRKDARETGILEEILLENKKRNPNHSFPIFDTILWEKVRFQKNLTLYLNTHMYEVRSDAGIIKSVTAKQLTTEKFFSFEGTVFIDCTGDGTLSALAGAGCMTGREGRGVFGEEFAVPESDSVTMGSSILFASEDMGYPVEFTPPPYAHRYTEEDLMGHKEITSGYWWVEIGGTEWNTIRDAEEIRDELLAIVYGIWDHIKNTGDHQAENYALSWIGFLPGKRESRRVIGEYILKEQDLLEGMRFPDAVAYGGWHIDTHMPEKFTSIAKKLEQTEDIALHLKDVYTIPYRSLYSADVKNLMMGGRLISASHRAFASTRVMGTCAVASEAAGLAAALAVRKSIRPSAILGHIDELQQLLLKDDCYIPGITNHDEADLARLAAVESGNKKSRISFEAAKPCDDTCSTEVYDTCRTVVSGYTRRVNGIDYAWESDITPSALQPARLSLRWDHRISVRDLFLTFDSSLSSEIMPSLSDWAKNRQEKGVPKTLVKDYRLRCYLDDAVVYEKEVSGNYQRRNRHTLKQPVFCNRLELEITATNGCPHARVYEVRVYDNVYE